MSILIVEDSKPMRNLIKRTLRQAGFGDKPIREAGDGLAALELINEAKPDIVLADWNMPKMTGIELLKKLRADGNDVKLGFVTSEQSDEMREMAAANGASFLIGKPFTAELFNKHLSEVFDIDATSTGLAVKKWLEAVVISMKQVAENPLGYASGSEVVGYPDTIPAEYLGVYLPFEGGNEMLWLCLFSDARGCQSISRALFAMGPDEEDLPPDEVGDALGEVVNIIAGLVKSQMREIDSSMTLTIGLPKYLPDPGEVVHRKNKAFSEVRIGPVSAHLGVVRVQ